MKPNSTTYARLFFATIANSAPKLQEILQAPFSGRFYDFPIAFTSDTRFSDFVYIHHVRRGYRTTFTLSGHSDHVPLCAGTSLLVMFTIVHLTSTSNRQFVAHLGPFPYPHLHILYLMNNIHYSFLCSLISEPVAIMLQFTTF